MGKGMRAGKKPGGGNKPGNMQKQVQQMQQMQKQMEEMQEKLEKQEIETSAGGGVVAVKVNGKKQLVSIEFKPEVVDPDDIETLQDLTIAAINEAMRQVDEMSESEMGKLTGGLSIPGLF